MSENKNPAPSVSVKALQDAANDVIASASDTYKKRNGHIGSFEDESGEKCWIVPFDAFEALRSALYAQVQDESEIVDCLLAGKPFVFDPATNFCHAVDGGAPEHGIKYIPTAQVQDVAIPEGWQLAPVEPTAGMIAAAKSTTSAALTRSHATEIYRAMLHAAPAKQEGGHD